VRLSIEQDVAEQPQPPHLQLAEAVVGAPALPHNQVTHPKKNNFLSEKHDIFLSKKFGLEWYTNKKRRRRTSCIQMVSQLFEIAESIKGWTTAELFYFSQKGSHSELFQVRTPFLFCLLMHCERIPMINVKSLYVYTVNAALTAGVGGTE
jgi:hypothetical protein